MIKNIIKVAGLAMLIVLCIGQMSILWLGDMSGHNFLGENITMHNKILVQPKTMWVNTGKLAYKVEERQREYNVLLEEFINLITSHKKNIHIEKLATMTYEELLAKQGILYEYGLSLDIKKLVGISLSKVEDAVLVEQVFIDMSVYNDYMTHLYFITADLQNIYKVVIYNRLEAHQKMVQTFNNPEVTRSLIGYQPSITSNMKQYIKGNSFLALNIGDTPIEYEVLSISNPIQTKEKGERIQLLEPYVNTFFANPLLKEVTPIEDGSIIFSENMGAIVKYDPVGTLEFNITSSVQETKLTDIERLTKVIEFIGSCRGIPDFLKEGLYLSQVVIEKDVYTYQFDYKYKGFGFHLTDAIKQTLGLEHILELSISNGKIFRGKWSILDIEANPEGIIKKQVRKKFDEIIDSVYEQHKDSNFGKIDFVQCRYILDRIEGELGFDWIVRYENQWYYP